MTGPELTPAEAAVELRTTPHLVRKLIRQGHLRARHKYPQGRKWFITEQAINEYRRACS